MLANPGELAGPRLQPVEHCLPKEPSVAVHGERSRGQRVGGVVAEGDGALREGIPAAEPDDGPRRHGGRQELEQRRVAGSEVKSLRDAIDGDGPFRLLAHAGFGDEVPNPKQVAGLAPAARGSGAYLRGTALVMARFSPGAQRPILRKGLVGGTGSRAWKPGSAFIPGSGEPRRGSAGFAPTLGTA